MIKSHFDIFSNYIFILKILDLKKTKNKRTMSLYNNNTIEEKKKTPVPKKVWYAPHEKEAYGDAEIQAVVDCLNDGWLAGFGPRTVKFEEQIAACFGKSYGLFVNSGSSAILLGLCALNLDEGSEVVTPACTFATSLAPIIQCKLKPVFCDVEIGTYVPSVDQVCEKITDKTRMILLPNLIGLIFIFGMKLN